MNSLTNFNLNTSSIYFSYTTGHILRQFDKFTKIYDFFCYNAQNFGFAFGILEFVKWK